jgi:hypothetical protein
MTRTGHPCANGRNEAMVQRIRAAPVDSSLRFAVAGDSGAWPDPTAEAIFGQLVHQVAALEPLPVFFANLGDFAGPGTFDRHERYLELVEALPIPDLCIVGNHDLDDPDAPETFERVHGPMNFEFGHGHTRFVAIHGQPGVAGEIVVPGVGSPEGTQGPRDDDLAFLDRSLQRAAEPNRVVLTHMPPHLDGHYAPHTDWGFKQREQEFLDLLQTHHVNLVVSAHGLAFDHHVHEGIHFVMSGGGGTGLCSHRTGICSEGAGRPEDRGALFHFVELTVHAHGAVSGRVVQAFAGRAAPARISFGDPTGQRMPARQARRAPTEQP